MPIQESLASLDAELNSIDQQLVELKKRRKELVGRREILIKTGTARAAELQGEGLHSRWESDEFEWSTALFVALKRTFRLETFRDYQKSAINAVMSGEDVLLVMSTGGGKSLVYQLPALVSEGESMSAVLVLGLLR